jgi:hypothetical protein
MVACLIVFNATFNNISVISWRSLLLVEETAVYGEIHRPAACHWQTLLYIYNYHPCWSVTRRFASQRKVRSPSGRVTLLFSGRQTVGSHYNKGDNLNIISNIFASDNR